MTRFRSFFHCLRLSWSLPRGTWLRPTASPNVVWVCAPGRRWPVLLDVAVTPAAMRRQLRREAEIVARME